jgi:tetratricopeptide (TPR) repeat protein
LNFPNERIINLEGLPFPPLDQADSATAAWAGSFDSVKLFMAWARNADDRFALTDEVAPDISKICAELEGIPLAIELAAAWVQDLGLAQMLRQLDQKFELFYSDRPDVPSRHHTLTKTIEWSFDLLSEWERRAFLQCCIFPGGFFSDAARAVIDVSAFPEAPQTPRVTRSLRKKSLLRIYDTKYGKRHTMYKVIREYAQLRWEQFATADEQTELVRRHADHYIAYGKKWNEREFGAHGIEAFDRIDLEVDNLLTAQDRALAAGERGRAARAILATDPILSVRRLAARRIVPLERSLEALGEEGDPELRARLLIRLARACWSAGEKERASKAADDAVQFAEKCGHHGTYANALRHRARMQIPHGKYDEAEASLKEALDIYGDSDDAGRCYALLTCGDLCLDRGDPDKALQWYNDAENISRASGDIRTRILLLTQRARALTEKGRFTEALSCLEDAEELTERLSEFALRADILISRAVIFTRQGDGVIAFRTYEQLEREARRVGSKYHIAVVMVNRGDLYMWNDDIPAALTCFSEAERAFKELGHELRLATVIGNRAYVLLKVGRSTGEARQAAQEASDTFKRLGAEKSLNGFITQSILARAEAACGNRSLAKTIAHGALAVAEEKRFLESNPKNEEVREAISELRHLL